MATILIAAIGSGGDVNPFIGIGAALRARGHAVTMITSAFFEKRARAAGLDFAGLGAIEDYERNVKNPDMMDWRRQFDVLVKYGIKPAIDLTYARIAERIEPGNTIVVSTPITVGARIAQEHFGFPMSTAVVWPVGIRSVYDMPRTTPFNTGWLPRFAKRYLFSKADWYIDYLLAADINAFRRTLGLAPVREVFNQWWYSPNQILGLWPDWYAPPQPDWPSQTVLAGFPLHDQVEDTIPDLTHLIDPAQPAPILFTTGSLAPRDNTFFGVAGETCRRLGRRGLLISPHPERLPDPLPPELTRITEYVPFTHLFARVAALVHAGGIGTASLAMRAGIPQVIVPQGQDHFDTAMRCKRLHVGATVQYEELTALRLQRALASLLASDGTREQCARLKAKLDGHAAIGLACDHIERLL